MSKYIIKAVPDFTAFAEIEANDEDEAIKKADKLMMLNYGFSLSQWLEYEVVDKPDDCHMILTESTRFLSR